MAKIKIALEPGAKTPKRSTDGAAGWDLFNYLDYPVYLHPGHMISIPTGVRVQLPKGYYWDIRIRSGLSTKKGIMLLNGAGVVDHDFRGIVHIPVINQSDTAYYLEPGEKIGQALLLKYEFQEFELVDQLEQSERGENGFGSTGRS